MAACLSTVFGVIRRQVPQAASNEWMSGDLSSYTPGSNCNHLLLKEFLKKLS